MRTAQEVRTSRWYGIAITVGLIAYGVVHLLVAWIALQLAWGNSSQEASHEGALEELASKPLGGTLLWIVAIGLFALAIWRGLQVAYGHLDTEKKLSSAGRGVLYLILCFSAVKIAIGSGGGGSGKKQSMSARLMENGAGRVLIVIVGLGVIALGVRQIYKAVTKKFTEDLVGGVSEVTILMGQIGHAAKGVAFIVAGALVAWAAIDYDPEKAGGLDTALRTIKDQPFGSVLLTVLALGIAAFGVYAFAWSRNAKR
ncbi:DUF1206 domain-containing protein [Kribbella sp. CA-247076]|uniref:DUF1206 domain-containing protein n=1 Tax=Kribbella sp. CA-247076 TaxID=3239941 RepID=UPI003D8AD0BA